MKNIDSIIKNYLRKQTQYAIQIVGAWGRGKTFYYKAVLEEKIKSSSTIDNASKKYQPIYISLFGVKSSDEIQSKIFYELLSNNLTKKYWFSRRHVKIALPLLKLILKGYLSFKGLGNILEFTNTNVAKKELVNVKHIVVVFDDLERKSKELTIEEFNGYVNALVEENVKVLIICNENEIGDASYRLTKEKVVGLTIEFNPDSDEVISSIITSRYQGPYSDFLIHVKSLLVKLTEENSHNYRHLIYALDTFQDIYSMLKVEILDSQKVIAEKCANEMKNIAQFSLTTAVEFKASNLTYKDPPNNEKYLFWSVNSKKEESPQNRPNFFSKYYKNDSYHYYDSILSFVTGNGEFIISEFEKEFIANYKLENGRTLPEYKVLAELDYFHYSDLSEEEYRLKTTQMVEYAKKGKYQLAEYLTIWYYATRFDNIMEFDLDKMLEEFLSGMSKVEADGLSFSAAFISQKNFEFTATKNVYETRLKTHGETLLERWKISAQVKELNNANKIFLDDINKLNEKYQNDTDFREYIKYHPIFSTINGYRFAESILKGSIRSIELLRELFTGRYKVINYIEEEATLKIVCEALEKYLLECNKKKIINWHLDNLQKQLVGIILEFESKKS